MNSSIGGLKSVKIPRKIPTFDLRENLASTSKVHTHTAVTTEVKDTDERNLNGSEP